MKIDEQRQEDLKKQLYRKETKEKEPFKAEKRKDAINYVKGFIGKTITITLRGGKLLTGKLEDVTQYELVLTIDQIPVIVMKHAIDYLEPDIIGV
jgi:sRNA-binding regulator protein Hfq